MTIKFRYWIDDNGDENIDDEESDNDDDLVILPIW